MVKIRYVCASMIYIFFMHLFEKALKQSFMCAHKKKARGALLLYVKKETRCSFLPIYRYICSTIEINLLFVLPNI